MVARGPGKAGLRDLSGGARSWISSGSLGKVWRMFRLCCDMMKSVFRGLRNWAICIFP